MSIHFHPLRIKEIKKETPECVSVLFEIPDDLKTDFQFKQGQSLTIRFAINGEDIRRTYSLCGSPLDNEWRIAIKKMEGGLFSTFANDQLKKNDTVEVMQPVGNFYTELNPAQKKNYVAFAAGSGITPILSIIKTTLRTEPDSRFTLVYGNKNKNSIIFKEELEALKDKFLARFRIIYILSRERTDTGINSGRITVDKLMELARLISYTSVDEFFLCGPEDMIFCIKVFLESNGINEKKIHFELFNTSAQKKQTEVRSQQSESGGQQSFITVKADGRSIDLFIPFNSDICILDAALARGADLPFACKGGMCCTCKARLLEGEVEMDVHWGLENEEIEKGFILTCQSHPKTDRVVIDFDIK